MSHFREHKFKYSFQEPLNPLCNFGIGIEASLTFFSSMSFFLNERCTLMRNFDKNDPQVSKLTLTNLTNALLVGNPSFTDKINILLLDATIE